jgi:hypothetical protein
MTVEALVRWLAGERTLFAPIAGEVHEVKADSYLRDEPLPQALILVADPARAEKIATIQRRQIANRS